MLVMDFNSMLAQVLAVQPFIEDPERDRLLDAARAEFIAHGLQRASVGEIARRAKVSRPTLYRKLGDKDDIIAGVVVREVLQAVISVQAEIAPLDTVEERVVEAFVIAMREALANPVAGALRQFEPESFSPLLVDSDQSAYQLVRTAVVLQLLDSALTMAAAEQAVELMLRISVSLLLVPTPALSVQTDDDARAFARAYLLPILEAARAVNPAD
jgi:AcrR family transcriptional regulator